MSKQLDLEQQIINLAENDEQFRKALLNNAKAAIEEKFGIKVPGRLNIVVVEDTAETVHLVLPPKFEKEGIAVTWT